MGYKQYCKEPEKIENYEKAKADNFKGWNAIIDWRLIHHIVKEEMLILVIKNLRL